MVISIKEIQKQSEKSWERDIKEIEQNIINKGGKTFDFKTKNMIKQVYILGYKTGAGELIDNNLLEYTK